MFGFRTAVECRKNNILLGLKRFFLCHLPRLYPINKQPPYKLEKCKSTNYLKGRYATAERLPPFGRLPFHSWRMTTQIKLRLNETQMGYITEANWDS